MYIFISHSSNEADTAGKLCKALEDNGHGCFIAPRDIRSGYEYAEEITNGIDRSDAILLILSKAANQSPHVLREVERAVTKKIPILVYQVEEVELTKSMEYFLMTHQWLEKKMNNYNDIIKAVNNLRRATPKAEEPPVQAPQSRKNGRITALVAAVVVVALVIGVAAFAGTRNQDAKDAAAEGDITDMTAVKLGDTITLGSYNGEDIYWRVLRISEDGTEAVLVSRDVLSVKAYDAPDSGRYNSDGENNYSFDDEALETDMELQAYVRGNSSWENSNIRTWLNSDSENVIYEGQAPTSSAMADGVNGYNNEKGFLSSFTEAELTAIKETRVETKGNALAEEETIVTRDRVFLLSKDELEWFEEADVALTTVPAEGAIANDKSNWYQDYCIGYGVDTMMWWLREPVEDSSSMCYLIGNGYYEENIFTWEVGVESFGIRPAITVDLTKELTKAE